MRVAHVITRLIVGGAQENTLCSVLGLREKPGVEVFLVSGPTTGPEGSLEPRAAAVPGLLTVIPSLVRPVHPLKDLLALRGLTRCFQEQRPDIVHTHSGKAGVLGRFAAARSRAPVVVHTVHGPSFGPFQGWLPNLLFGSAERAAAGVTTHFVCVAEAMRDQYLQAGIARPDMYSIIRSGFELEPFLRSGRDAGLAAQLGLEPHHLVVGKIARLFKLKGHEDLLAVAPELVRARPEIRFLLVGDGEWRARLEGMACRLGVREAFVFCGLVPPERVPDYVGMMDILVHLSAREGLARALPQALAAGKPVVAYDCDGAREVCLHETTGLLVPTGDRAELQRSLLRLAESRALRERLGARGRGLVSEQFGAARMVETLFSLYQRLLGEARVRRSGA